MAGSLCYNKVIERKADQIGPLPNLDAGLGHMGITRN